MPKKGKKERVTFIGIDLAWSVQNRSGGAVIRDGCLIDFTGKLGSNAEILHYIEQHIGDDETVVVGIDAPLRVPNETGSRRCDNELTAEWRHFQAGALPANRRLLSRGNDGQVRGEQIVQTLVQQCRFGEAVPIPKQTSARIVCEIYPHPAHVSLFGLERTLKYKARHGRRYESRWREFERYQCYLRRLRKAKPPLKKTKSLLTQTNVRELRGRALKEHEDMLDAITCAYVASYLWHHGPRKARVYGNVNDGHIVVPLTSEMKKRLQKKVRG